MASSSGVQGVDSTLCAAPHLRERLPLLMNRTFARTKLAALLCAVAVPAAIVAGCGGVPGDSVATVDGNAITKATFAHWLGASDPSLSHDVLRDGAIRGLVLSPSSRGRRCLDGMIDDCALLLELRPVSDPWLQAYDSVDYSGLVERRGRGRAEMEWSRCVAGKDVGICAGLLRNIGPDRAATPAIRQSLFTFAVKRGGEMAWLRLRRAAGRPVADQLTSADRKSVV